MDTLTDTETIPINIKLDFYRDDETWDPEDNTTDLHGNASGTWLGVPLTGSKVADALYDAVPDDIRCLIAGNGWDDCGNPACTHILQAMTPESADDMIERFNDTVIQVEIPMDAAWISVPGYRMNWRLEPERTFVRLDGATAFSESDSGEDLEPTQDTPQGGWRDDEVHWHAIVAVGTDPALAASPRRLYKLLRERMVGVTTDRIKSTLYRCGWSFEGGTWMPRRR